VKGVLSVAGMMGVSVGLAVGLDFCITNTIEPRLRAQEVAVTLAREPQRCVNGRFENMVNYMVPSRDIDHAPVEWHLSGRCAVMKDSDTAKRMDVEVEQEIAPRENIVRITRLMPTFATASM